MITNDITALVKAHYKDPQAPLLMLSNIGARLRRDGKWPIEGETRSLAEVIEATPGIAVERDPASPSFIAVVPKGREAEVAKAIAQRRRLYFLRGIPRALLVAFTCDIPPGEHIFARIEPRPEFTIAVDAPASDFIRIDEELRRPGLAIDDLQMLTDSDIAALENSIRTWTSAHGLQIELVTRRRPRATPAAASGPGAPAERALSALERLYAAQPPELATKLIVPIDIAIQLSRMP